MLVFSASYKVPVNDRPPPINYELLKWQQGIIRASSLRLITFPRSVEELLNLLSLTPRPFIDTSLAVDYPIARLTTAPLLLRILMVFKMEMTAPSLLNGAK